MALQFDNSFFYQNLNGIKVLVLVPHEDDEINTCGSFLMMLSQCGAEITLVFTTNGDWKYKALTRMREARDSAKFLGVSEDHIIFLGFGDSINNDAHDHIFYAVTEPAKSTAGHIETYGTELYPDYAYKTRGKHQAYLKSGFLEDLLSVIVEVKADLIICTDFDEHPDHRMLSLLFDEAIGIVCKNDDDYRPEVWKRFAYALAYTAISDYSCINNPQTMRPDKDTTEKYAFDIVDTSIYSWESRIRIPVMHCENENIRNSLYTKALSKHKSQRIITHADRIINSDEVYWKRRTDNLAFSAAVSVSSGNGTYLNDFMLFNVNDVDGLAPAFMNYYWHPEEADAEKKVEFKWNEPQHIEQLVLYSSIDPESRIKELSVELGDGYTVSVKDIPNNGNPCVVDLGTHDNITNCIIKIISYEGDGYGLGECEFFSTSVAKSHIKPFIKILSDDNFLYEYVIREDVRRVNLDLYRYGIETGEGSLEVMLGKAKLDGMQLIIDPSDKEIIVKCKTEDGKTWDQVFIKRVSENEYISLKNEAARDKAFLINERKKLKIHNMLYILTRQGPISVVKRTIRNVILPRLRKQNHET